MKEKIKMILKWAVIFVICIMLIYLFVLVGGWKLFESGNPLLIEIGVALILSIFVFAFSETSNNLENKIKDLERRINELERNK